MNMNDKSLLKETKPKITELQKWFDEARWYGEVNTPLGVLKEYSIMELQRKHYPSIELEYN